MTGTIQTDGTILGQDGNTYHLKLQETDKLLFGVVGCLITFNVDTDGLAHNFQIIEPTQFSKTKGFDF